MLTSFVPQLHVTRRMKNSCRPLFFALVFSLLIPLSLAGNFVGPAWAAEPAGAGQVEKNEAEAAKDFIRQLQALAAEGKRQELAGLVDYPLPVNGKPAMEIKNAAAFVKNYDAIFTKAVQKCLRGHDLNEDVFARNGEYMVGDGCIWFFPDEKGNMAMSAINP